MLTRDSYIGAIRQGKVLKQLLAQNIRRYDKKNFRR